MAVLPADARILLIERDVYSRNSGSGPALWLVFSSPGDRETSAPAPIQLLARIAVRVELQPLERESIDALVSSVFGDVPHRSRLTEWLVAAGQRNPGHSLELLKLLVDRVVIRYVGGAWVLPAFLPEQELPSGVDAALHARLQALGPDATRLARMFALQQTALPLHVCLQLAPDPGPTHRVALLDRLVGSEILLRAADTYRFAREALRESTLRGVPPEERAVLHGLLAHALLKTRSLLPVRAFPNGQSRRSGDAQAAAALTSFGTQELCLLLEVAGHLERAHDNPLLHGLTHKARALVAIQQRDREMFEVQLSEMEVWFERTENPALLVQCQRLAEQAQRAGLLPPSRGTSGTHEIAARDSDPGNTTVTVRGRPTR